MCFLEILDGESYSLNIDFQTEWNLKTNYTVSTLATQKNNVVYVYQIASTPPHHTPFLLTQTKDQL